MDVADLVRTGAVTAAMAGVVNGALRLLSAPALHMLVIGGLLFAIMTEWGGALGVSAARPEIVIPGHRIEITRTMFQQESGRPPTAEEHQAIIDALVDQEVLYRYALDLGMDKDPVVQRRLAQIASFVEANPHQPQGEKELAGKALELGLHHGDLVVRRVLSDGARRLIRAVVLVRQPDETLLREYYLANRTLFLRPAETSLTHVDVDGWKHGDDAEARARLLLEEVRRRGLDPAAAVALGDESVVPARLPFQTDLQLRRRFGALFADALNEASQGEWHGPVPSRHGYHLVYIHQRRPPYAPPLEKIREQVQQRYLHTLADQWLASRLRELRATYDVVVAGVAP